jgi:hypothetical protein
MGILPGREAISPAGVTPSLLGDMPSRCDMPSLPGTVSYILLKEFSDFRNERGRRRRTCPIPRALRIPLIWFHDGYCTM